MSQKAGLIVTAPPMGAVPHVLGPESEMSRSFLFSGFLIFARHKHNIVSTPLVLGLLINGLGIRFFFAKPFL